MSGAVIVIPARFASTRLPGKPLADIHGKPMIQHVWEKACLVASADRVLVAVDDERVQRAVAAFGGEAIMTSPDHPSGTDRLAEVMQNVPAEIYLNLQGDEPLVRPADLQLLLGAMQRDAALGVGTLCHPLSADEAGDPNQVKVVRAANGDALYFSRARIPYCRDDAAAAAVSYQKHVGVYAYRRTVLSGYSSLPESPLEQLEKLEQLRLLSAGIRIGVFEVAATGPGVDTPEGLEEVRRILSGE